jgi:hypothetical protein
VERLGRASISEQIIHGEHGLHYLTDSDNCSIFIAASSVEDARRLAAIARDALLNGDAAVPAHALYDHPNGAQITVPLPEPLTPEQRLETVLLLQRHLAAKFESH